MDGCHCKYKRNLRKRMGIQKSSRKITWRSGSLKWALIDGYGLNLQGFPFSKINVSRHWRQVKRFVFSFVFVAYFFSVNILVALYHKILNGELAEICTHRHAQIHIKVDGTDTSNIPICSFVPLSRQYPDSHKM